MQESEQTYEITVRAKCKTRDCDWEQDGPMRFLYDGALMQTGEDNVIRECHFHHVQHHWEHPPHHQFALYSEDEEVGYVVAATSITTGGVLNKFLEEYFGE